MGAPSLPSAIIVATVVASGLGTAYLGPRYFLKNTEPGESARGAAVWPLGRRVRDSLHPQFNKPLELPASCGGNSQGMHAHRPNIRLLNVLRVDCMSDGCTAVL